MTSIHGNSKVSTFDLSESKARKNEHQSQPQYMPVEEKIPSVAQVLVRKGRLSHCPKFRLTANKKEKEVIANAEKANKMSRWMSEGRDDAPWCLVNIVDKGHIHQPGEVAKDGKENQWSLDGEHGSS